MSQLTWYSSREISPPAMDDDESVIGDVLEVVQWWESRERSDELLNTRGMDL